MDFNDLPIPFACVATDMITGNEVVLRNGSVPTAMRASMAIPGVFSPVTIDNKVLVDGGLVNNFPADVLQEMGADIIIGVEVTSAKDVTINDLQSLPQVFAQLVTNSTSSKRKENREICQIHIVPDISGYGMLSFTPDAIETLVGRGYKKAEEYHDQFKAIKDAVDASAGHPVNKTLRAPRAKNLDTESVLIRSITFNNVSDHETRWLIRKGRLKVDNYYSENEIERAMKVYRGTGCFDEITYQVKEIDSSHFDHRLSDAYNLNINMKPAPPHVVGLGVRYDTEEGAALLFHLGLNEKKFGGVKFNTNIKMSYSPKVNFTLTYAAPSVANFSTAYDYRNEHFSILVDEGKYVNLQYHQHKTSGYISQFHLLNLNTKVGLSYTNTRFDLSSLGGDSPWDSIIFVPNTLITPFVNMEYDNLDDAYFAKHGIAANLTGRYHLDKKYQFKHNYLDLNYAFRSYITPSNGRFTFIPQVYGRFMFGDPDYFNLYNLCGGEIAERHFESQMPFIGLTSVEYLGDESCVLRGDLRYNFYGQHYLTAMYNIVMHWRMLAYSDTIGDLFSPHMQGAGLKYSYNSPVGPISLTAHWANLYDENHFGAYFSFGYTF
jgi:NTE family protein